MRYFKVVCGQKDYGHGSRCYMRMVEAENADEAEKTGRKGTGVEDVWVTEVTEEEYRAYHERRF